MVKKINAMFETELTKNQEKGGAWLGEFSVVRDDAEQPSASGRQAFSNASAGKRCFNGAVAFKVIL